tara:strand:+ start:3856 stop:5706 length:1851 start_codon:yes stop_codon:yes gene_type:complete
MFLNYINTIRFFNRLVLAFIFSSIIYGNDNISILQKDAVDSLNVLAKKSPKRAIRYGRGLLEKIDPKSTVTYDGRIHNKLGEIFLDLQMYGQAMSHFTEAKLIRERLGIAPSPWLIVNIGNVYYQQEKYLRAKKYYNLALDIFNTFKKDKENRLTGRKVSLSNLGRIEVKVKNYDEALDYFKEALSVVENSTRFIAFKKAQEKNKAVYEGTAIGVASQHHLIASLYLKWGQYNLALKESYIADSILKFIIEKSELGINKSTIKRAKKNMGENLSLLVLINMKLKKFEEALVQSRTASQLLKNWPYALVDHMEVESDFYSAQEELYLALESLDRGLKICDIEGLDIRRISLLQKKLDLLKKNKLERSALDIAELINIEKTKIQKERMTSLFDDIEHKAEIVLKKEQLTKSKKRQTLISILLGVLLVLTGTVALNLRTKKKYINQQAQISKQEKILVKQKLKIKENDLAHMSTYVVSKNDLLNSIVRDLEYHTSLIENKKDRLLMRPLKKKILDKIDESADWDQFQLQFTSAYPEFIENLTSEYPLLRSGDIKLCCYLKMNMNTKDVAQVTGLSVRAIENKRYRLRKKLNLGTNISLESFLHSPNSIENDEISGNQVV